jgi:hypothetical protein
MKIGDILLSISDNVQRPLKPVFEDDMRSNQQLPDQHRRGRAPKGLSLCKNPETFCWAVRLIEQ